MFGERLKKLREECNLPQSTLAENINISQQALSKWENGYTQPDNDSLIKLAEYFCVSVDYLLGKTEVRRYDEPYNNELEKILFSKAKDLSDEDKKAVLGVINAIKKDVDKDLDK